LVNKGKGPYQRKPSLKESLGRHHAADFAGITNIHKERFNDIVFIMPQCQLVASELFRNFKKPFSSQSGT